MELKDWVEWATIAAGLGAIASATAAWILVLFTKRQIEGLEIDYRESRVSDLASQLTTRSQIEALLKDWRETLLQRGDALSYKVEALKSDSLTKEKFASHLDDLSKQSIRVADISALGLVRLSPTLAISAARIHQSIVGIAEETQSIAEVFSSSPVDLRETAHSAAAYLQQIRDDVSAVLASIDTTISLQLDEIQAMRNKYDRESENLKIISSKRAKTA